MMQTVLVKGSRLMINVPSIETRAREIASIMDKARFAELVDELIGEVAEKPRHLERVLSFIPPRRLIDAIVFFGEKDNSLVLALPWELTLAAMLKVLFLSNTPDGSALVRSDDDVLEEDGALDLTPPVAIDRRERAEVITKDVHAARVESRREIRELAAEMLPKNSGNTKRRAAGRHGGANVLFLDDVPEFQEESPKRMSDFADPILDFRPVLAWWSHLKHREDAEVILDREVFSRSVSEKGRLTMRDVLLVALWQEASFPEDVDDVADGLIEDQDLGFDGNVDRLRRRMYSAILRATSLCLEHVQAVNDEVLEDLGALLPAFSAPGFPCWGFFRRIEG